MCNFYVNLFIQHTPLILVNLQILVIFFEIHLEFTIFSANHADKGEFFMGVHE